MVSATWKSKHKMPSSLNHEIKTQENIEKVHCLAMPVTFK
jgi:hypothetical protein